MFVCHTYMFNVGSQRYVIVYSVKCKGLQTRPLYIFLCYNSMYLARKSLIWIIRTISLIRTAYKISLPKGVRITGVGLYLHTKFAEKQMSPVTYRNLMETNRKWTASKMYASSKLLPACCECGSCSYMHSLLNGILVQVHINFIFASPPPPPLSYE